MRAAQDDGWTVLCLSFGHAMAEAVFRNQEKRPDRIACAAGWRWCPARRYRAAMDVLYCDAAPCPCPVLVPVLVCPRTM